MRWGKVREKSPRPGVPYYFRKFIDNHFDFQHNHIVYLTSNRFYVYFEGEYKQRTPTKTALKRYVTRLMNLFYFNIQHRVKQPEHVRNKLEEYGIQGVTDEAVGFVQNHLLKIKDRLQVSYNIVIEGP